MKVCDLTYGVGQLTDAFGTLKDKWIETKSQWTDENSRQFEKITLNEIPVQIQFVLAAAQRLAEVLEKAESECADREEVS